MSKRRAVHRTVTDIQSVVLENLASTFMHPCVMDVKLGTVLHGPDATPEKAARMEKKAKESTIGKKGMRMTGCKVSEAPRPVNS